MSKPIDTTSPQWTPATTGAIPSAPTPTLPIDMIFNCLSFLTSAKDVVACSGVCKQWHKVAQDNRLWTPLLERDFPHLKKQKEGKAVKNAKQVYQDRCRFRTNLANGVCATTTIHTDSAVDSLVSIEEGLLILGFRNGTIEIWDLKIEEEDKRVKILRGEHTGAVDSLILSKNKRQFISGSNDRTIKIWDLEEGTCLKTLRGHTGAVVCLVLTEGGQLISGSYDKTIKIWDLTTGTCLNTRQGHVAGVTSLILTKKGQLISGDSFKMIKIWDLTTGTLLSTFQGHAFGVTCLVLTEGGQLISGSYDDTIKIWDLEKCQCLNTLEGHKYAVASLIFIEEENQLISISYDDGTIKVWNLKTGTCLKTLQRHSGGGRALLLTKEGQLISGSIEIDGGAINIFDFNASNKAIFQELAEIFESMDFNMHSVAMERFLRMPEKERKKIYEELGAFLGFSNGEDAFHDRGLESTPLHKSIAITNYLKKLPNIPENLNISPIEEIVEKPTEELNEVFQYFTDILQITKNQKKVFFPKSEFSAAFIEHAGLINTVDLQAIGINPKLMENLAQLQGQLKQLSQKSEQKEKTNQHQALETITPIRDSIESLLVNLSLLIELGKDVVTVPLEDLIRMQSSLIKQLTLLKQVMESPQTCNQFADSGDLFEFACSLLADVAQFEQYIKHSQIELLNAYLSQPFLNTTWENLQANGITQATQLAKQSKNPSEFYRM